RVPPRPPAPGSGGAGPARPTGPPPAPPPAGRGGRRRARRPPGGGGRGAPPVVGAGAATTPAPVAGAVPAKPAGTERPRSTPPVRKLARDLGVALEDVVGTGPSGLIGRADVHAAAAASLPPTVPPTAERSAARTLGGAPRVVRTPIRGVRKHTAAAMVASAFTAPHATEFLTIDVTPTMELLARLRAHRAFAGIKLTPLTMVAKAVCVALERTPALNSAWDEAAGEIAQLNYVNLGIAAATPRGLTVPNIKDAQSLDLAGLGRALAGLAETARAGRTTPADLAGGTISITNIGVFGIDAGTPILNPGEAAILAVGQVRRMPWEYRDEVALRQVMTLSLSFDHRLVDGEQGSRFLADVGTILADPGMLVAMV
ncbi:dihydrolipoamide acetyltransferase family protein, partial [Arthrobacter sp.]|uniref:dihydrolipoamide acetyltransferase family protein n=1 Tax=Arthrobacter sp. TaxID=1667 RepID=UPI0036715A11